MLDFIIAVQKIVFIIVCIIILLIILGQEDQLKKYRLYEVDKNYKEPFLDNHKVKTITLKANEFLNVGGGKLWFVDKQHAEQHLEQLPTSKEYNIKNR